MTPRSATTFAIVAVLAFLAALFLTRCMPASSPREEARAVVTVTAEAVRAAGDVCAAYSLARSDLELARACRGHYDRARIALIATASAVDAWERADRGSVSCAVAGALEEVSAIARDLVRAGARVPPVIEDAQRLAPLLGGCP